MDDKKLSPPQFEDEVSESHEPREERSFWQSVSVEKLAEEQGVDVVSDIQALAELWPADDDSDALMELFSMSGVNGVKCLPEG